MLFVVAFIKEKKNQNFETLYSSNFLLTGMENSWLVHLGVVNADWLDLDIGTQGLILFSIDFFSCSSLAPSKTDAHIMH